MDNLREKIRERAYYIWEARAYYDIPGDHHSDWLQAEREIVHAHQFHDIYDIRHQVFTRL